MARWQEDSCTYWFLESASRSFKAFISYPKFMVTATLLEKVYLLKEFQHAISLVSDSFSHGKPVVVSFINAHAYNLCFRDKKFAESLSSSDFIFRDGIGMEVFYRLKREDPGANINGTDYIPELLNNLKGKKIALFGTNYPYLTIASDQLTAKGHKVTLTEHGFQNNSHYINLANQEQPEVIVLGMGMPKQEHVARALAENLLYPCIIINGGAILDFWGGRFYRAPVWIRRIKFEWLFRLSQEPSRLFSRYVFGNSMFLCRVVRSMISVTPEKKSFNVVKNIKDKSLTTVLHVDIYE